jgi:hypothetical protein
MRGKWPDQICAISTDGLKARVLGRRPSASYESGPKLDLSLRYHVLSRVS